MASLYSKNKREERKITILYELLNNWKASQKINEGEENKLMVKEIESNEKDFVKILQQR